MEREEKNLKDYDKRAFACCRTGPNPLRRGFPYGRCLVAGQTLPYLVDGHRTDGGGLRHLDTRIVGECALGPRGQCRAVDRQRCRKQHLQHPHDRGHHGHRRADSRAARDPYEGDTAGGALVGGGAYMRQRRAAGDGYGQRHRPRRRLADAVFLLDIHGLHLRHSA